MRRAGPWPAYLRLSCCLDISYAPRSLGRSVNQDNLARPLGDSSQARFGWAQCHATLFSITAVPAEPKPMTLQGARIDALVARIDEFAGEAITPLDAYESLGGDARGPELSDGHHKLQEH